MYSFNHFRFVGFLFAFIICSQGFAETVLKKSFAASTVELKKLLEVEDELVENLKGYVEVLKKKFRLIEQSLIPMSTEHNDMKSDYETYLGNPVNSFRLIHRLHTDWRKWHNYAFMNHKDKLVHIEKAHEMRPRLPTALDLEQACRGIDDLMSFYNLRPNELAAGNLAGYSDPQTALTAQDCFALGEFHIQVRKEDLAEAWLNTSLSKFTESLSYKALKFNRSTVHTSWGLLLMRNKQLNSASSHFEKNPKVLGLGFVDLHFQKELAAQRNCNAVLRKPSRLHCRYNSSTTPFTRIAPLKMEELSTDPYMVVFHDVIYDSEIDSMLNSSEFSLSLVDSGQKSDVRSSKDSYIDVDSDTLEDRVRDMTGLNLEMSDAFSLINYGLGGHYILHYDYHNLTDQTRQKQGDRIATVLFYLGDVESGGATIFPMVNISVTPKKGSAVLWYNLHNSGAMNLRTLHSACPVISGSKYVLTKWINELSQMFSTPCMKNSNLHPKNSDITF
ncbi:hypothetical protein KR084_006166 [Drosophila pseudotakahashii]|nr:hypothetical protein KR084_006166 [Drosophila pseudotakahashii]